MDVQTRSLSSSIAEFFRKPTEQSAVRYGGDDSVGGEDGQRALVGDSRENMALPDGQGSLLLYETSSQLRPPVLPILPIQRLRLLRQKQELRRRLNSNILLSIAGPQEPAKLGLLEGSYRRPNSSTPSPVKNATARETVDTLKLLKTKRVDNGQRKGTKWSGEFDYDLSEYDNHSKESKGTANITKKDQMDSPTITATKSATLSGGFAQDVNACSLSAAQRDVLIKGQPIPTRAEATQKQLAKDLQTVSKCARPEDKTVMPSIGFDFVKPDDTPSKTSSVQGAKDSQASEQQNKGSFLFKTTPQAVPATKPSFTFAAAPNSALHSRTEEDESDEPRRKRPAGVSTGTAPFTGLGSGKSSVSGGAKPLFSFGKDSLERKESQATAPKAASKFGKPNSSPPNKDEESQTGTTSSTSAVPSFSFGKKQSDDAQTKTPSLFGNGLTSSAGTKPSFSFGRGSDSAAKAPVSLVNQDTAIVDKSSTIKSADSETIESKPFNGEKAADTKNPAFSFGLGATNDKKDAPAAPAFSFGRGSTSDKPAAAPSFSFGAKAPSEKDDTSAPPSLTFGKDSTSDKNDNQATATTFTFGGKAASEEKTQPAASPSFSLGSDAPSGKSDPAAAPSFSFGAGASSDKKESGSSSLTFGNKEAPFSFNKDKGSAVAEEKMNAKGPFTFSAGNVASSRPASAGGFSFNRIEKPTEQNIEKASFNFGGTDAAKSSPSIFGAGGGQSVTAPTTAVNGFSFNKPTAAKGNDALPNMPARDDKANTPSFGFKFGAGNNISNNNNGVSMPAAPVPATANPFLGASQNNNAFSFNMPGNTNTTTNAPSFGPPQPSQIAFGTTPSPAFGKSASPPALNGSDGSSRAFTPSNTINMKFTNNASVNPSSIFSGGSSAPNMGTAAPQQVFGGTPPPTQVFGAGNQPVPQFGNAPVGFGTSDGLAAGQLAQPAQQAPMPNFQLPPGRKLARMRQSRR